MTQFKENLDLLKSQGGLNAVLESDGVRDALIDIMEAMSVYGSNARNCGRKIKDALEAAVEARAFEIRQETANELSDEELREEGHRAACKAMGRK